MPPRRSTIPHRISTAWMFAQPETAPALYTPIDNVGWCAEFVDNPTALAIYSDTKFKDATISGIGPTIDTAGSAINLADFISNVQTIVHDYRMQSAAHCAVSIHVMNMDQNSPIELSPAHGIRLRFSSGGAYAHEVTRVCRLALSLKGRGLPNGKILVREKNGSKTRWVPLPAILGMYFPPNDRFIDQDTMDEYWDANGSTFNWTGLPTELKLLVMQKCVSSLGLYKDDFNGLPSARRAPGQRAWQHRVQPQDEVALKLGAWKSLLFVSKQSRQLAMYLLLAQSEVYKNGLCIASGSYNSFDLRLRRLGNYHQMMQPNSVLKAGDKYTSILDQQYKYFAKQHPGLERFATYKHDIRKIKLQFNFLDCIHFFKVTTDDFDLHRNPLTCDVFDQLPLLSQIEVDLPKTYDKPYSSGFVTLFDSADPCPRTLHRVIYAQIANELALYANVTVCNYMDVDEEQRFTNLRESAQRKLKFTAEEMIELYAEDQEGGIALSEEDLAYAYSSDINSQTKTGKIGPAISISNSSCETYGASSSQTVSTTMGRSTPISTANSSTVGWNARRFFPPICKCNTPCYQLFDR